MTICMQPNTPHRIGQIQIGPITISKYALYQKIKVIRLTAKFKYISLMRLKADI